jgi:hypothetical protein
MILGLSFALVSALGTSLSGLFKAPGRDHEQQRSKREANNRHREAGGDREWASDGRGWHQRSCR